MSGVANDIDPDRLEQAGEWCMRLADGKLSSIDQERFETWLESDTSNRRAFERTVGIWQRFGEPSTAPEVIALRADALEAFRDANEKRWSPARPRSLAWLSGIAAALLLLLLPAWLYYASLPDVYQTGTGERQVAVLGDGSRVSLDAATRLEVKLSSERRELVLEQGRARFDVAKDALRPFSVRVGDQIVVATGTSFSVELVGGTAHVVLYEGHVSVIDVTKSKAAVALSPKVEKVAQVELQPGNELIAPLSGGASQIVAADFDKSVSWESGQLTFVDEPLSTAAERVNRYSEKKIEIADASVASLKVNGVYNAGDADAFAVGVNAVLPVRVHDTGGAIIITRR